MQKYNFSLLKNLLIVGRLTPQARSRGRGMADFPSRKDHEPAPAPRWYVVHTQPHRERRAAANLERQGTRVFLPLIRKTVRHARQFRTVTAPFFARYLFVELVFGHDRWRHVNSTYGVSRLIMEGDGPKPAPPGVVEGLLARVDRDGVVATAATLKPGQRLEILTGPFAGLTGRLLTLDDRERVQMLLDVLGNGTRVATTTASVGLLAGA